MATLETRVKIEIRVRRGEKLLRQTTSKTIIFSIVDTIPIFNHNSIESCCLHSCVFLNQR